MLTIYAEKSFYERDYNQENIFNSNKNFYFNYGWVFYLDKKIPFYIKYNNEYKETVVENEFIKTDKILFGSFTADYWI